MRERGREGGSEGRSEGEREGGKEGRREGGEGGKEGKRENMHTPFCYFCQCMFYFFHVQLLEASRVFIVEVLECHLEAVMSPLLPHLK